MHEPKLGRVGGIVLGLIFVGFGLWGVIGQKYDYEGYRWRPGINAEGLPAVIIGAAALVFGLYVLWVVMSHRD